MPNLLPTGDAQKSAFPAFPVPIYIRPVVDDEDFTLMFGTINEVGSSYEYNR